jgi:hypothetical protein
LIFYYITDRQQFAGDRICPPASASTSSPIPGAPVCYFPKIGASTAKSAPFQDNDAAEIIRRSRG